MSDPKQPDYRWLLFIIILLLGFSIYWFGIRPETIENRCKAFADSERDKFKIEYSESGIATIARTAEWREASYQGCLKNNGNTESAFDN